eukprot:COSAG01_NODE_5121_length_4471_cov_8.084629_5_plen_212_part_00
MASTSELSFFSPDLIIWSSSMYCILCSPDTLTFFVGADANSSSRYCKPGSQCSRGYTGAATLRRDGFADIGSGLTSGGELLTRTLSFSGGFLFVNANVSSLRAEVTTETGVAISPFTLANCVGGQPSADAPRIDSTKLALRWDGASLATLAGKPVRLRFQLGIESHLYAFWVSDWQTGESAGFVAAGGPAYGASRDLPHKHARSVTSRAPP